MFKQRLLPLVLFIGSPEALLTLRSVLVCSPVWRCFTHTISICHRSLRPRCRLHNNKLGAGARLPSLRHGCVEATRPTLLTRFIVSRKAPGITPKKRRPASDDLDGQIRKLGDGGVPPYPKDNDAPKRNSKKSKKKKSSARLLGGELWKLGGGPVSGLLSGGAHARRDVRPHRRCD